LGGRSIKDTDEDFAVKGKAEDRGMQGRRGKRPSKQGELVRRFTLGKEGRRGRGESTVNPPYWWKKVWVLRGPGKEKKNKKVKEGRERKGGESGGHDQGKNGKGVSLGTLQ